LSYKVSKLSKQCIAVSINLAFTATANLHAIRDHTVLTAIQQRWESRLYSQPRQALDLATLEGCKAELGRFKSAIFDQYLANGAR